MISILFSFSDDTAAFRKQPSSLSRMCVHEMAPGEPGE